MSLGTAATYSDIEWGPSLFLFMKICILQFLIPLPTAIYVLV
jgi:hypothetical protein